MKKLIIDSNKYNIYNVENFSINSENRIPKLLDSKSEYYLNLDKNYNSKEIDELKKYLMLLNSSVKGIFFVDLGVANINQELNLNLNLIYAHPHLLTNPESAMELKKYKINSILLTNDLDKEEIDDFYKKYEGNIYMLMLGYPEIFYSKRKLISSYNKTILNKEIVICDKKVEYVVSENNEGTIVTPKTIVSILELNKKYPKIIPLLDETEVPKNDLDSIYKYLNGESDTYTLSIPSSKGLLDQKTIYKVKK